MTELFFANLTSPQAARLLADRRRPVLLLPLGAVEPHGPHAPLLTDPLISLGLCVRAARRLADHDDRRALVLPSLPYGVTRYGAAFTGAVHISENTLHALIVDVCTSLIDQGFPHLALVNNHFEPEHVRTVRRAVDTIQQDRGVAVGYLNLLRRRNAERLTAEFRAGECHAGCYETSLVLADHPELVDQRSMRELPRVAVDMPAAMSQGRTDFLAMGMDLAYCGSPAEASAEEGERTFAVLTDLLLELVDEMLAAQ